MIARVFPSETNFTPTDEHAYFDVPGLFTPQYDEVHISTVFTWDIPRAEWLAKQWERHGRVIMGGPAFGDPGSEFEPGLFMRHGCVFTSRGCPNTCWFCYVPKREGGIRELKIHDGNTVMDNNLLACSEKHIVEVFKMLSDKHAITFSQGLEAKRITPEIGGELQRLKIKRLWLAYDRPDEYGYIVSAFNYLGRPANKIHVYVLAGFQNDTPEKAEGRCMEIARLGCYPFMMLYQPETKIKYSKEWKTMQRKWTRPAIWKTFMRGA